MRGLKCITTSLAMVLLTAQFSFAQSEADLLPAEPLSPEQENELLPAALVEYDKALDLYDKILYPEAMAGLEKAADKDPRHVPLQFLTARAGISLARIGRGFALSESQSENTGRLDSWGFDMSKSNVDLANDYYAIAAKSTQRILDNLNLPEELFERAKRMSIVIDHENSNVELREARRANASFQFLKDHVREKYPEKAPDTATSVDDLVQPGAQEEEVQEGVTQQQQQNRSRF